METKITKEMIVSLIRDDLTNSKLVNALDDLGLDSSRYELNLGDTVFQLMGIKDVACEEDLFFHYLKMAGRVEYLDLKQNAQGLTDLAEEIYAELLRTVVQN